MSGLTFESLEWLSHALPSYRRLRQENPTVPAAKIVSYLKCDSGESFEEFCCPGHEWVYTGSAYGGDDDSYHGEGRVYCSNCGADGDA